MSSNPTKRVIATAAALVVIGALGLLGSFATTPTTAPQESVEVGFTATAPGGEEQGLVVPASCPSYSHYQGNCVPPSFDASCPDGSNSVNEGDTCEITWSCVYSSSSSGINFSTGGATSGSAEVTPSSQTTYTAVCSNGGRASETVSVVYPNLEIQAEDDRIPVDTRAIITWSSDANVVESCSVTEDNPEINDVWSGASGSETTSILSFETVYTLTCTTSAGSTSESATVRIIPFFEEF